MPRSAFGSRPAQTLGKGLRKDWLFTLHRSVFPGCESFIKKAVHAAASSQTEWKGCLSIS